METMAILSAVAGIASAGMGVVQGIQSSRAAGLERAQYEEERKIAMLAADQEENVKRKRLEATLALNEAVRAGRGLSLITGTSEALRAANIEAAEDDIATGRLNASLRASRASYGALGAAMRQAGGLFSGAGAFVSGIGSAAGSLARYSDDPTGRVRIGGSTSVSTRGIG